jgi:hypothetical protein
MKAITGFDVLRDDDGYAATLEVKRENLLSSHAIKRFFRKFTYVKCDMLRVLLNNLFIWRLHIEKPEKIVLDIDTMVLDNDDAHCREGVSPTYKSIKGFQNLQITYNGIIIDAVFRRGSAHSNHGNDVKKAVKRVVELVRKHYRNDVPIIITSDSGFLDEKNLEYFDKTLGVFFVCFGKLYDTIKEYVSGVPSDQFCNYTKGIIQWQYLEFGSKLKSWKTIGFLRTIFTKLVSDENGQMIMDFARPDSVLYTNIGCKKWHKDVLKNAHCTEYLTGRGIINLAHGRGRNELVNRSVKDFMTSEHLPFRNFGMNAAYYYLMVIGHVLLESYKMDVLRDDVPLIHATSYPSTVRRRMIDFAACIVRSGNYVKLQVTKAMNRIIDCIKLWDRCKGDGLVPIPIL